MSLDPHHLTNSNELRKRQQQATRIASEIARRKARQKLLKMAGTRSLRRFARNAIKHVLRALIKKLWTVIIKALTKMLAAIGSALIGLISAIGLPAIILAVVIIVAAFIVIDFNFDGESDELTILPIYEEVSKTTVDMSKSDQAEWKVPTGLIAAFVQISQLRNSTNSTLPGISDTTIPEQFIPIYKDAEARFGTPWYLLAAIHKIETGFSTHPTMVSSVGAVGHFQFMKATWAGWKYSIDDVGNVDPNLDVTSLEVIRKGGGYGIDGDGDGRADPWNLIDAAFTASHYLAKNGATFNMRQAVYQYNHSQKYVNTVLALAEGYKDHATPVSIKPAPTLPSEPLQYGKPSYKELAKEFVTGLEPSFTYTEFETKKWSYKEIVRTHEDGSTSTTTTEQKVVGSNHQNKITEVDTFRGNYSIEYDIVPGEYRLVSKESTDNRTVYSYEMEEEIEEKNRFYSPSNTRLISKAQSLGFSPEDYKLALLLFNQQVKSDSPEYTNRLPFEIEGDQDSDGFDMGPGETIPPELLNAEYVWPVPTIHRISSGFGNRPGGMHRGIDITNGNAGGEAIYAMADGVVLHAGPRDPKGFGQAIYIYHGNGLYTRYGHLQWDAYGVKTGEKVKKGQFIGRIGKGKVGQSTGPHLHFEVIINGSHTPSGSIAGKWINPLRFVRP